MLKNQSKWRLWQGIVSVAEDRPMHSSSKGLIQTLEISPVKRAYRKLAYLTNERSQHMLQLLSAKDKAEHVFDDFLKHFR
jgi:hypothetical protein